MSDPTPTKALTKLDQAKQFLDNDKFMNRIKAACGKAIHPTQVASAALTAILKNPKLAECFTEENKHGQASVMHALLTATQMGLTVNGRDGHLVPFNVRIKASDGREEYRMTAVFVPDYKGLIQLAYNHPAVGSIWSTPVFAKDEFVYSEGLNRTLYHVPYAGDDDPGELKAAYAVCKLRSNETVFRVLRKRDIVKIKARSPGASKADSPWKTHEPDMWCKSAVKQLCKFIPQSAELRQALDVDDSTEVEMAGQAVDIPSARVPSPTLGENDPDPDPFAPSFQDLLASEVLGLGANFDQFIVLAISQGWIKDTDSYGSFAELPEKLCRDLVQSPKVISTLLQR